MKLKFDKILQNEQSAKRNVALKIVIDTFSKLTLPDLTISSQNMCKEGGGVGGGGEGDVKLQIIWP